jgi:hypothetical protein
MYQNKDNKLININNKINKISLINETPSTELNILLNKLNNI